MKINKSKLIRRVVFSGVVILIMAVVFISTSSKLSNKAAGISTRSAIELVNNLGAGIKFCDDPTLPDQHNCIKFIQNALAAVNAPYQNVSGDVSISGNVNLYNNTINAGDVIFLGSQNTVATSAFRGINFHTTGDLNYYIGKPAGTWTQPLNIAFYTGIKLGANTNYGGTKFYASSDMATELMSVGNGDNNVRVANNLYVGSLGDWLTNRLGQDVRSGASPTFTETYTNGWFRNNSAGAGLYNQALDIHFWPCESNSNYWCINDYYGLKFVDKRKGATRGYTFHDGWNFGLLNGNGNWMLYSPSNDYNVYFPAWGNWISSAATHRGEGTNFIDYTAHLLINYATWGSNWYWSGQGGQPTWLWGSNDGTNMYVWNPSNFRVNYASSAGSAGNADTVDGYHAGSLLKWNAWDNGNYYQTDGNIYMSWLGDWISNRIGQDVRSSAHPTFNGINLNGASWWGNGGPACCVGTGDSQYIMWRTTDSLIARMGSSIRYKENVKDYNFDLEKINKLRPVTFKWKANTVSAGKADFGLIAEEVAEVFPEITIRDDKGRPDNVSYPMLSVVLLKNVQSLNSQMKDLNQTLTLTSTGNLVIEGTQVKNKNGTIINTIGAFAEMVVGKIKAGVVETQKLIVSGVDILQKLTEQQNQINNLTQKVEEQNQVIQSLKDRLDRLEKNR